MASAVNCKKCVAEDTDDMVQCDNCDQWYHFNCVGVDNNVANVSWSCESCIETTYTPTLQSSSKIKDRSQEGYLTSTKSTVDLVQSAHAFRSNEKNIHSTSMATANILHTIPPPSSIYTAPIMSQLPLVSLQNTLYSSKSTLTQPNWPTASHYQIMPPLTQTNFPANYVHLGTSSSSQIHSQVPCTVINDNIHDFTTQRNLELKKLEEEMELKQQYLEAKYKILAETKESSAPNIQLSTLGTQPTQAQLTARQSIPKQLPPFNGDPDDWPLFISSYENSTLLAGYSNAENLIRLQSSLKGKAREMVKNKLLVPQLVPEIIQTLRMCFGRPEHILERVISKARGFPPVKDKLDTLIEFAMCVRNICATMEACEMHSYLNNPLLVKELVDKLPNNHKLSWAMFLKDDRVPIIKSFSDWLYIMAEAASSVTPLFGKAGSAINTHSREVCASDVNDNYSVSHSCIVCNNGNHKMAQCDVFKNMSLNRRWECIKTKNICRQCLGRHRRKCNYNKECGIDGCKYKHHPLLHKKASIEQNISQQNQQNSIVNAHGTNYDEMQPLFRIIPVNIHTANKIKKVFAFLDEGSAVTLIEKNIFDELGLQGDNDPLCLRWTGDTTRMESDSLKANIIISNVSNNKKFKLNAVHTVANLGLSSQTIDSNEMAKRYPYLANLPIQSYYNATPVILLGADNWHLAVPLKIKEGQRQQPIASKTRLGWTLQGCNSSVTREFQLNIHACDCQQNYNELHNMVKEYFRVEESKPTQLFSKDDNKALSILENTCKKVNGHYEVGLLWRNLDVLLPDSYNLALNRLRCLQNKYIKNPSLKITIQTQIDNLIQKGYAKKLSSEELKVNHDKTWYLPIFIVSNPNKPDKVRLVWDAAAKSNGASLNDFLMTGPDLLNPLIDILLNFRIGKIAICSDISEMFHRVNIRKMDMNAQRFLWYNKEDINGQPSVFVMRALTFGISCAPCIAHYVRDRNAEDFKKRYPRAVEAIQKNHYVDDFIDSAPDEQQAIELAKQVREIHKSGGFNMHNWASNSEVVLNQLCDNVLPKQTIKEWGSTTKILGLYWDPTKDEFRYVCRFARLRRDILNETITPTKRETLQVLMSIFDPLGFVSCYTTSLKILLQEIWRSGIAWDDKLTDTLEKSWFKWKVNIHEITSTRIPRCYSPQLPTADEIQLHTFVDAGENAYAAICYLRVKKNNVLTISLIAAKSKVAPLKPLSVPRLELQAALLGTRLGKNILRTQRIKTDLQYWWSDSKTILSWLQMDPKKFHPFVMHRVGEILENTNVNQWRWIPSKENPADLATKIHAPLNDKLWFCGPEFLRSATDEWPHCENLGTPDKTEIRHYTLVIEHIPNLKLNIEYFSNWRRLYRAVATFILYCHRLRELTKYKVIKNYFVNSDMIKSAQTFLIIYAQKTEYKHEIFSLENGKPISRTSKLISLNVYLDNYGVIRAQGRAEYLNNHEDVIVLPTNNHVTFLLVRYFHEKFRHQCHETALNEIKGQYYIAKLRVLFRKVRRMCQWCKNFYIAPQIPQMAALPAARLAVFERPFTFVGIDYFGPLNVAVGRRREKRWGVIFTCLTVRAIHIEISHSLDTSSCIMAIRNFISRRGTPKEIYSDNGTNFKAAEKIFRCEIQSIDASTISTTFENIKWKFNPPASPHMGGAWERLVRSIKTVLYRICPTMSFNDESLKNAMCETEFTINCRPLTFVSIESSDDEAITPNHLLIGSSDGYKPTINNNIDLRQRWYKTQEFAEQFWRRWLKEYVPIISRRSKWFTKQPPIKINDVVIIVDPDLPRNHWPKGTVIDVVTAKDGQVRRATVKTKNGIFQRPVAKLAILDLSGTSEGKLNSTDHVYGGGNCCRKSK